MNTREVQHLLCVAQIDIWGTIYRKVKHQPSLCTRPIIGGSETAARVSRRMDCRTFVIKSHVCASHKSHMWHGSRVLYMGLYVIRMWNWNWISTNGHFSLSSVSLQSRRILIWYIIHLLKHPWASYQIRKIAGCACAVNARNVFPRHRGLAIPTCIRARAWHAWRTCHDVFGDRWLAVSFKVGVG